MRSAAGETNAAVNGGQNVRNWFIKNRVASDVTYEARHSWPNFAEKNSVAAEDPTAVYYTSTGSIKQINPQHEVVINRAENYAREYFDKGRVSQFGISQERMSVPISPPDGNDIWPREWEADFDGDGIATNTDHQKITNNVFDLTNNVAKMLKKEYPGKYASVLSYSNYSMIPSDNIQLEDNVFVEVTTFTRGPAPSLEERLRAFKQKGVLTSIYEYYDVWPWWKDRIPPAGKYESLLSTMKIAADTNTDIFYTEASDNWLPKGRLYWMVSKLMWEPYTPHDELLDDYYTHAFGPAKEPMKNYYTRFDTITHTPRIYALAFQDLKKAKELAADKPEIVERINQVILHTYFWWKWGDFITDDYKPIPNEQDTEDVYVFIRSIKDYQMITSRLHLREIAGILKTQYGMAMESDWIIPQLENKVQTPTEQKINEYLIEAQAALESNPIDAPLINASELKLVPLNSELPKFTRFQSMTTPTILIPASENETVTIKAITDWPDISYSIYAPDRKLIETIPILASQCRRSWKAPCIHQFTTTIAGTYIIKGSSNALGIDLDHAASVDVSKSGTIQLSDSHQGNYYFYVPNQTPALVMIYSSTNQAAVITSPDGTNYTLAGEVGITNPQAGVWTLKLTRSAISNNGNLTILGIAPLIWHDPKQLLIPANLTIKGDLNNDANINILDVILEINAIFNSITETKHDINEDGTINILDVIEILKLSFA